MSQTATIRVICMYCKRTYREGPLSPEGRASHGICPDCLRERHPEIAAEMEAQPLYTDRQCMFCGAPIEDGNTPRGVCDGCRESNERHGRLR